MTINEWKEDFKSFIDELQMPRDDYNGIMAYINEGAELLKEQEPRVMTLDEVRNLQSLYDGAVWLEALSGLFPALPEICMPNITFFIAIPLTNYRWYFDNAYYEKTWRCWTARPTEEQRKAVGWK